jgi:hypothetical protein
MRNPYAPPLAAVADPISPAPLHRPRQVVVATWLLWAALALGIAKWMLEWGSVDSALPLHIAMPAAVAGFAIRAWLMTKIDAGRNWARVTFLVLSLWGFVAFLATASRVFARSPTSAILKVSIYVLLLAAFSLIFTRPGSEWFKRG